MSASRRKMGGSPDSVAANRIPETSIDESPCDSAEIRARFVDALRLDLIGPRPWGVFPRGRDRRAGRRGRAVRDQGAVLSMAGTVGTDRRVPVLGAGGRVGGMFRAVASRAGLVAQNACRGLTQAGASPDREELPVRSVRSRRRLLRVLGIVTNKEVTGRTLWFFIRGRGTHEKVHGGLKGGFAFDCVHDPARCGQQRLAGLQHHRVQPDAGLAGRYRRAAIHESETTNNPAVSDHTDPAVSIYQSRRLADQAERPPNTRCGQQSNASDAIPGHRKRTRSLRFLQHQG